MPFPSVVGQERPKSIVLGALERGTLAGSYLFFGPRGVGKLALALELAKAVNCLEPGALPCGRCSACRRIGELNHPDVFLHFPTPAKFNPEDLPEILRQRAADLYHAYRFHKQTAIHIELIRKMQLEASYKPYQGRKKVFILVDAEQMTLQAANALLKTLEEPAPNAIFILTVVQPSKLPATVLSRCQQIRFVRLTEAEVSSYLESTHRVEVERRQLISRLAQGDLDRAIELLQADVHRQRAAALKFLNTAVSGNLVTIIKLAEGLARSSQRSVSEEYLETLETWFRDMLLLLEGKDTSLIHQDLRSQLEDMVKQYHWEGIQQALRSIQETRDALAANVRLELAWMVLLLKLRRQRRASV